MKLRTWEIILLWITLGSVNGALVTTPHLSGMLGEAVTLTCALQSPGMWYVMQWKRLLPNGTLISLGSLPNYFGLADPKPVVADSVYQSRVSFSSNRNDTMVKFDMRIADYKCADVGTYQCILVADDTSKASTNLSLTARPKEPVITQDLYYVESNQTFSLECVAVVGLPACNIRWYIKEPDRVDFHPVDHRLKQEVEYLESDECVPRVLRRLYTSITEDMSGVYFRCQVEGYLAPATREFMDELEVRIPEKPVTGAPHRAPGCTGKWCTTKETSALASEQDPNGSSVSSVCLSLLVISIGSVFLTLML